MTDYDVCIMGGGIGGLSTAHELRKLGFTGRILVLERNDEVGGLARSRYVERKIDSSGREQNSNFQNTNPPIDQKTIRYPTEYCWRIYGPNYRTLRRIMSEIPSSSGSTVLNNLVDIDNYLIVRNSGSFNINYNLLSSNIYAHHLTWPTIYKLIGKFTVLLTSSTKRIINEFSEIKWIDYIAPENQDELDLVVRATGPYLGVDLYNASVSSIWQILESAEHGGKLSVMNGPTSDKWFTPWSEHLRGKGVDIWVNTSVDKIIFDSLGNIDYVECLNASDNRINIESKSNSVLNTESKVNNRIRIKAKYYVNALSVSTAAKLLPGPFNELSITCQQWMVGIQYYFDQKVSDIATAIHLSDSPWQLIIEPQKALWRQCGCADQWSIGICDDKTLGLLTNKPASECTRDEIGAEVWHQVKTYMNIRVDPSHYELWYSYQFSSGKLSSWEPKFSPNYGSWKIRPDTRPSGKPVNWCNASHYVRTGDEMILMDAAARAGVAAAQCIVAANADNRPNEDNKFNESRTNNTSPRAFPWLLAPMRALDSISERPISTLMGINPVLVLVLYLILLAVVLLWVGKSVYGLLVR